MHPIWRSSTGKLFVGGCGAQLGLVLTFGGLLVTLLACAICGFSSALSLSLNQTVAQAQATPAGEAMVAPAEVELLRQEMDVLLARLKYLRQNVPTVAPPTPTPTPTPPTPMATASQSGINLRSGPGVDYNRIGRLALGESLPIVGRNNDSSWWLVATPGGGVAWVSAMVVAATYADDNLPVVSIPALLVQPAVQSIQPPAVLAGPESGSMATFPVTLPETGPEPGPISLAPPGTPTAVPNEARRFVQDTLGYKQLIRRLLLPTVSESFAPHGDQIAITERISLYTVTPDGATKRLLLEDDGRYDLAGGVVWSPDGRYLAFVANQINGCQYCRRVGLVRLGDGQITYLEPPSSAGLDLPRWTQDGRLLVTAHAGQPEQGAVYVYDTSGQGQIASGRFSLSSSHNGQKWFPWQPGKVWETTSAAGVASYYAD